MNINRDEGDEPKAYMSPHELFTSIPEGEIGEPTYWHNDSESPHIYGWGVDLELVDYDNPPNGEWDEWEELHETLHESQINAHVWGDSSYVHADWGLIYPPMITVELDDHVVEPGWGADYISIPSRPEIRTRSFNITGSLAPSLAPFPGTVILTANEVRYSGGHMVTGRTMNHDPVPSRINFIGPSGAFSATYEDLCQWGGQFQITAHYIEDYLSYSAADTTSITFSYLDDFYDEFGINPDTVIYTGGDPVHDDYLYIDYARTNELIEIIRKFRNQAEYEEIVPVVRLNDISLPDGGRFVTEEYNNSWWEFDEHLAHRQGCQADIGYEGFQPYSGNWELMKTIIIQTTRRLPIEYSDHFHVKFWCQEWAPGTNEE